MHGDARHPCGFITDDAVRELIDFSRPVGVLFVAVLHFLTDEENPYKSVAWIRDRIAPGSYLAISHITSDGSACCLTSVVPAGVFCRCCPACRCG